jgi:hypothetical protein
MSDFGRKQAELIRYTRQQREEEENRLKKLREAIAEEDKLKARLGPELWLQFKLLIASKCREVNNELDEEYYEVSDSVPDELQITKSSPHVSLVLKYYRTNHSISFKGGRCNGEYLLGIAEGTREAILTDASDKLKRSLDLEATAEFLLTDCFEKLRSTTTS